MPPLNSDAIRERMGEIHASCEALVNLGRKEERDLTEDEQGTFDGLQAEYKDLQDNKLPKAEWLETEAERLRASRSTPQRHEPATEPTDSPRITIPAQCRFRYGKLQSFHGADAERDAYVSGRFLAATLFGHEQSQAWCQEHGIKAALSTQQNSLGGVLVPPEFEQAIIDLREGYGVFRQKARRRPMMSDTLQIPRRTGGVTAYFVADNTEITASDKGWDSVSLTARKLGVLCKYSSEIAEEAIISIADDLAPEIAYAFAVKEDACGFLGTGTNATYGGIEGLITACTNATATTVEAASGNTAYSTLDLTDFESMVGKLPMYPGIQPEWYIHKAAWAASMMRLQDAAGGNTTRELAGGAGPQFLGYPVNLVQTMNSTLTAQTSTYGLCYFGDLSMAASFGDRRGVRIKTSDQRYLEYDQLAIQGTERFDINVHDVGKTSNAGAMIMLSTPSS